MTTPSICFQPVGRTVSITGFDFVTKPIYIASCLKGYLYPFGKGLCKSAFSIAYEQTENSLKRKLNDRPNRI